MVAASSNEVLPTPARVSLPAAPLGASSADLDSNVGKAW